jgi:ketosteroid isomerase-like protein
VLADEFVVTYGDGSRGDKAKELSLARDFNQQVDSSKLDDFIVKVYGNTAVVMFTQHLVGPVKGKPVAVDYRYIDVWVNRDGVWKCVASQSTRVGMKE